jgi:hypothetical protein
MMPSLSEDAHRRTKAKLADLEQRLAALEERADLSPPDKAVACRSCRSMIQQYRKEIELFEAANPGTAAARPS